VGRAIVEDGGRAPEGTALALIGELGSGKTVFTKGLAAGAGVADTDRVTSPTFVLRQDYQGALRIHHYDVYRLGGPEELVSIGFLDDLAPGALVVVEWADRVLAAMPPGALVVQFDHPIDPPLVPETSPGDSRRRRITFRGDPERWSALVDRALGDWASKD
jgi:tRNA threonylcarbamoyladenosine biosynthesis protein TsaE